MSFDRYVWYLKITKKINAFSYETLMCYFTGHFFMGGYNLDLFINLIAGEF